MVRSLRAPSLSIPAGAFAISAALPGTPKKSARINIFAWTRSFTLCALTAWVAVWTMPSPMRLNVSIRYWIWSVVFVCGASTVLRAFEYRSAWNRRNISAPFSAWLRVMPSDAAAACRAV